MSESPRRTRQAIRVHRYAVGIGARPGVAAAAVRALLDRVAADHGIDLTGAVFATVASRAGDPGLRDAVRAFTSGPVIAVGPDELAVVPVPNPSARVASATGTPSVAEAAAMHTAGSFPGVTGADLVVPKTVGDGVTVAVAVTVTDTAGSGGVPAHR